MDEGLTKGDEMSRPPIEVSRDEAQDLLLNINQYNDLAYREIDDGDIESARREVQNIIETATNILELLTA